MPSRQRVIQFTEVMTPEESARRSNGWTYDSELGWVHCSAVHNNGVDNSKTFYHGHHTPAGNFFTAWAIKDRLAKWLDPAPLPYRP